MSIRARLVTMCLVVALLPAVPLTLLVQSLLDKSFGVGLSPTVEDALQSGLSMSRERFDELRRRFQDDVHTIVADLETQPVDSAAVATALARHGDRHDGFVRATPSAGGDLPPAFLDFAGSATLTALLRHTAVLGPRAAGPRADVEFYETESRTVQLAVWKRSREPVLFFRQTNPEFLVRADRLIEGRQIFAELRLKRSGLIRSFFYPFVVIYGVCVLLALAFALFMAERLAEPLRRLVLGTNVVAGGDWSYRLDLEAGGETGQLVGAFNSMVARLDEQRRRIVDVEKMASWRDVARHLAHEIKNPLLPIRLTVEEIRDQYKGDDAGYRNFLLESTRVVGDELDHLQQLVKSFSSFAKMPELTVRRGSLEELIRDVARLYPQVQTTVGGGVLPGMVFDPDLMRRVVVNLYDNVVSVVAESATVDIVLRRIGDEAVMTFADNGPGIPDEHLAKVFEPYFTTRTDGSGLGLAILKNIVLMHGGAADVESAPGRGTTFTVRLPIAGPPDGVASDGATP